MVSLNRKGKMLALMASLFLVCSLLVAGQYYMPAFAEENDVDAEVTVTSPSGESYGVDVTKSYRVLLPWWSLGVPDNSGAWILYHGWIIVELESEVHDCNQISIWAANLAWWSPLFKVYTSMDGISWHYIGNDECRSNKFARYDFTGSFENVKYIKITRTGSGKWSPVLLDAVYAKGGDV